MMFRAFLKDSAIYASGGILARALSLLLLPFYTRVLTPDEYGVIDLLTVFGALVNVSVALEISQGLSRYLPEAESADERASWASTALWFTLAAFALFAAVCVAFARPFAELLLESSALTGVFLLGVVSATANAVYYLGQTQLRWLRHASGSAIANLVFTLTSIGATVAFVLYLRLGVSGVLYGQITGFLVGAALTVAFARAAYRLTFSWEKCRRMLRFSLPFVPSSLALFAATYVDRFAIKELLTLEDVGIYGVAYRLASPMLLILVGFQTALTPLVLAHYKEPETPANLARIFRYFVVAAMLASVLLSVFAPEIVAIFAPREYAAAARLVPLLAPALLLPQMYVFAPGLFIAKRTTPLALMSALSAAASALLNVLLIPVLGLVGSALANLVVNALAFATLITLSQKHYRVPHDWRSLGAAAAGAAAIVAAGLIGPMADRVGTPAIAWHALLAGLALVVIPLLALGRDELRLVGGSARMLLARERVRP